MARPARTDFSKISEALASWSEVRQLIRGGDSEGKLVPVVIPKSKRRVAWLVPLVLAIYPAGLAVLNDVARPAFAAAALALALVAFVWLWRGSIVEIEQGTTGIRSRFGAFIGTLSPGRHYLWWPWDKVEVVVDTSTEIPYVAPVVACPTRDDVPVKSIEFFLKFRIEDPVAFVRTIGAGNFDMVLSSAVQDAIRQRGRLVQTERAYDLRGRDVGDMQDNLNRQLERYGVRIMGANIPDVQLPDQYQQHLSTRERVAKELVAFEREWELTRKRRIDTLLMEIERAKKFRDAKLVEVKAAQNKARQDVAQMLEERETEAQRVRWEAEARGRTSLTAAKNEAKARHRLAHAYRDNQAVLQYELAQRQLQVGAELAENAPRPVVMRAQGSDTSALSTLLLAQLLPNISTANEDRSVGSAQNAGGGSAQQVDDAAGALERGREILESPLGGASTGGDANE